MCAIHIAVCLAMIAASLSWILELFIWFDAMTAYKQIMLRLTTALTGIQKHNKIFTPLSDDALR